MGHHKLREDKKCQNCGFLVRWRYCGKCGQENMETRKSFHYLFTHFVEDLVHYDGSFWKTLKNLLFKPGVLTKEYLEGKRKKYVAPVKLYIFVSFIVFFVGGIIANFSTNKNLNLPNVKASIIMANDSIVTPSRVEITEKWPFNTKEKTLREYDSVQSSLPENLKDKGLIKILQRKEIEYKEQYTLMQFLQKLKDESFKNIPKFLFFYMPVFAFFMWLFHSKKKWYFFDHGIFTLHYFSFLLLSFFITIFVLEPISYLSFTQNIFFDIVFSITFIVLYTWIFIYFFKAHKITYGYSNTNTILRGLWLLLLNLFFLSVGIVVYILIIFYIL